MITRGTTPYIEISLDGPFQKDDIENVEVYFSQKNIMDPVIKTLNDLTLDDQLQCSFSLSQDETLTFKSEDVLEIQVRILLKDGQTLASRIYNTNVGRILKEGVICQI